MKRGFAPGRDPRSIFAPSHLPPAADGTPGPIAAPLAEDPEEVDAQSESDDEDIDVMQIRAARSIRTNAAAQPPTAEVVALNREEAIRNIRIGEIAGEAVDQDMSLDEAVDEAFEQAKLINKPKGKGRAGDESEMTSGS